MSRPLGTSSPLFYIARPFVVKNAPQRSIALSERIRAPQIRTTETYLSNPSPFPKGIPYEALVGTPEPVSLESVFRLPPNQ